MVRKLVLFGMIVFISTAAQSADRTGLVGEWLFNDGTANDSSGNGNHGVGNAIVVDGLLGKAFEFDGTMSIAVNQFSSNFNFTQNFTLECWVYVMGGSQTMIRKGPSANFLLELGVGRTNDRGSNPQFGFATNQVNIGASITYAEPPIPLGKWTMLNMTYDGSKLRGYVNGELAVENVVTGNAVNNTSQPLLFGNYSSEVFIGRLDEIRIWARTLSPEEIAADYDALAPVLMRDRLVGEWLFDGNANDTSSNGNHGAVQGAVQVPGLSNQAYEYDGNSVIQVTQFSDNFVFTDQFSLAVWVKPQAGSQTMVRKGPSANFLLELGVGRTNDPGTNPQFGFATDQVGIGASITYGPALPLNEWSFLSMTYDGAYLNGYINGVLVSKNPITGNAVNNTAQPLLFGNYSSERFFGQLDEIRIWSRTISPAEINRLFNEHAAKPGVSKFQKGERAFDDLIYVPGKPIPVRIQLIGQAGAITVTETPPAGWNVFNISHGGQFSNGVITWNIADFSGDLTVSYEATPPAGTTGEARFTGRIGNNDLAGSSTLVQGNPIGFFDNHLDIGAVGAPGTAAYDATDGSYTIIASGREIWNHLDEFHFAYVRTVGNFTIRAFAEIFPIDSTATWTKAGLVVREDLTPQSAYALIFVRTDLQMSFEWRPIRNVYPDRTGTLETLDFQDGHMEIQRVGDLISLYYIDFFTGERVLFSEREVDWQDPVYVGLAVSASGASSGAGTATVEGVFKEVEFIGATPVPHWEVY